MRREIDTRRAAMPVSAGDIDRDGDSTATHGHLTIAALIGLAALLLCLQACTADPEQAAPGGSQGSQAPTTQAAAGTPCPFLAPASGLAILGHPVEEFQPTPGPAASDGPTTCATVEGTEQVVVYRAEALDVDPNGAVYPEGDAPVTVQEDLAHPDLDVTRISQTDEGATGATVVTVRMMSGTSVVSIGVFHGPSSSTASAVDTSRLTEDALVVGERLLGV